MTWELALQLALRYGPGWVEGIINIIQQHGEPTAEAWAKVMALAVKPYDEYLREAAARAGVPWAPAPPAPLPASHEVPFPEVAPPAAPA